MSRFASDNPESTVSASLVDALPEPTVLQPGQPDTWTFWKGIPKAPRRFAPRSTGALANRLTALLSRLEQGQARLASPRAQRNPAVAVALVDEMLDELLTFARAREEAFAASPHSLSILSRVYQQSKVATTLHAALRKDSLRAVLRAVGLDKQNTETLAAARQLVRVLPELVKAFFAALDLPFSPTVAASWSDAVALFVADLSEAANASTF